MRRLTVIRTAALSGIGGTLTAISLIVAGSAPAATIPVTNTNNAGAGSLRAAIAAANGAGPADVIAITAEGTIDLQSALPGLVTDMTIAGPGADRLTVRRDAGGLYRVLTVNADPDVTISGLTVTNGRPAPFLSADLASTRGGGMETDGTVELSGVAVIDNVASASGEPGTDARGGGIVNFGELTIRRSTIADNNAIANGSATAHVQGGGISNLGGTVRIVQSTVSGNEAEASGGSASIQSVGGGVINPTELRSATIAGNTATENGTPSPAGGSNLFNNGTTTIENTIVADPVGAESCSGPYVSLGHNLDEDRSCSLSQPTDIEGQDPRLGPLADNGGPTDTRALLSDSPAIDKGACGGPADDQRGATRPSDFPSIPNAAGGDGSDIGAFELQAPDTPSAPAGACPSPPTFPAPPSNEFSFGRLKKNKRKGTAKLTVIVPGPGALRLAKTKKVKAVDRRAEAGGEVTLPVKPKGRAKKKLRTRGKATLRADVTYAPDGGEPNTQSRSLKLKRKRNTG